MLLDTNILIIMHAYPDRLKPAWAKRLLDPAQTLLTSATCIWEIAIKYSLKKPGFQIDPHSILRACNDMQIEVLDITPELTLRVVDLPQHHTDPFDRLIIAQALQLGIKVMTTDKAFKEYGVEFEA